MTSGDVTATSFADPTGLGADIRHYVTLMCVNLCVTPLRARWKIHEMIWEMIDSPDPPMTPHPWARCAAKG